MAKSGQTFRILLRMLADVSEGHKGDALYITSGTRAATTAFSVADAVCREAGIYDVVANNKNRTLTFPNGRKITFRGPTTGEDVLAEKGHVLQRFYDGAT